MPLNRERVRRYLLEYRFDDLFIDELGWDVDDRTFTVVIKEKTYTLQSVAQKRGFAALICEVPPGESYPYPLRKQIEARVTRDVREHIVIFVDRDKGTQAWQRVHRRSNQPDRVVEHTFQADQSGDALLQKLEQLAFDFEREEELDLLDVTRAADSALQAERVTKKFYTLFKKQHTAFLKFIEGIPGERDREWYASIMLNRLMFVYFIQAKGFLDGDTNYLPNRLRMVRQQRGPNEFHSFYRSFLLTLFHDGLARDEADRDETTKALIGRIPYLNGGIFEVHELEARNDHIDIPDQAFEEIFAFFDQYQWHLDDRPLRNDNEINPDVLGYIFEKYINQKQMGAYYTKEDITEYIGKNTIIPFLFDRARKDLKGKGKADAYQALFGILQEDPDRYIYPAMRHGVTWDVHTSQSLEAPVPYPENIAMGLDTTAPDLLKRRRFWNTKTPPETALPTEIWRETIARHQRYAEIKAALQALMPADSGALPQTPLGDVATSPKPLSSSVDVIPAGKPGKNSANGGPSLARELAVASSVSVADSASLHEVDASVCGVGSAASAGLNPQTQGVGVQGESATPPAGGCGGRKPPHDFSINDLITYNCDIRRFAQDVIERADDPDVLNAFWRGISEVTVLDPTCGSGAFLFAALNILEPLYESCLSRMRGFMLDWSAEKKQPHPNYYKSFAEVIARVDDHPNEQHFIYKSIIIGNLYGVDIMDEAIEICKLRLFLKLASLVQPDAGAKNYGIEPLPDIDFNIRAGNTLVGFATYDEVKKAITREFDFDDNMGRIENKIKTVAAVAEQFRRQQTERGGAVTPEDKRELRSELAELDEELNRYLAQQYGVDPAKSAKFAAWKDSHKPFHWFVEFYRIVHQHGGFDVIIGNPPYVELSKSPVPYKLLGFRISESKDLYAYCVDRSFALIGAQKRLGLIVPVSIFGVDGFANLQQLVRCAAACVWSSSYANRPAQVFTGAQKRLTIAIVEKGQEPCKWLTSNYLRWRAEERENLLATEIQYAINTSPFSIFPTSLEKCGESIQVLILQKIKMQPAWLGKIIQPRGRFPVFYTRSFQYFLQFLDNPPEMRNLKTGARATPTELKQLVTDSEDVRNCLIACLTSSCFFWYWNVLSDCRNLNGRELERFPIPDPRAATATFSELASVASVFLQLLHDSSKWMTKSGYQIETFSPSSSKPLIDEIDTLLASHYGFTAEELDFIINYDIKYRMGNELENYVEQTVKKWEGE